MLETFQADLFTRALYLLAGRTKPAVVLLGHSLDNLHVAPRLACKLAARLVTDCIRLGPQTSPGRHNLNVSLVEAQKGDKPE